MYLVEDPRLKVVLREVDVYERDNKRDVHVGVNVIGAVVIFHGYLK
jgi:hypothetical protein